ncbi:MAG: hypothetical protein UR26_C0003G0021 [candidate division TM6 bacterium GW2011_GWF2_32_72]|nr:MAG: hypothetical protein UR26_C0003G0021 [candidate division TM6 bacterium GW2011_GWF2_32_72]
MKLNKIALLSFATITLLNQATQCSSYQLCSSLQQILKATPIPSSSHPVLRALKGNISPEQLIQQIERNPSIATAKIEYSEYEPANGRDAAYTDCWYSLPIVEAVKKFKKEESEKALIVIQILKEHGANPEEYVEDSWPQSHSALSLLQNEKGPHLKSLYLYLKEGSR